MRKGNPRTCSRESSTACWRNAFNFRAHGSQSSVHPGPASRPSARPVPRKARGVVPGSCPGTHRRAAAQVHPDQILLVLQPSRAGGQQGLATPQESRPEGVICNSGNVARRCRAPCTSITMPPCMPAEPGEPDHASRRRTPFPPPRPNGTHRHAPEARKTAPGAGHGCHPPSAS